MDDGWLGLIADEGETRTRPRTRNGVGKLANCYGASSKVTPECSGNEAEQGGTRQS